MDYINNAQAADIIGIKPTTLEIWRIHGKGPAFRKFGRSIRYVKSEVVAWLDSQTFNSTSQYSKTA
ncbi:helix-turn-helix transcriptional regulator [Pseudomonas oryzihabitans]|uniref:helix-turn-helix transcriptional regulator n=1 Tax=Pseudomonas oryzihabitans TaxID=47885 RepID=UPI0005A985B1|nr:helix-turn-helix domain-containing protein [Pseudomonas oryzihabitans]NMZ47042.1 helix-turn-helix domain-containing protein [Pseudomonas oryzihabitans]